MSRVKGQSISSSARFSLRIYAVAMALALAIVYALGVAEMPPSTAAVSMASSTSAPSATLRPTASPPPTATTPPAATDVPTDLPPGYWALEQKPVAWEINCENEWAWDGFTVPQFDDYCVPGLLSRETLLRGLTANHYGVLSSYADGIMERLEAEQGVARGHGVAVLSCQLIGYTVWLRVPGLHEGFQGPFTVVDCGAPEHMFFQIAGMGLAAEVGYTTAQQWGIRAAERVDVSIGSSRPNAQTWQGVDLAQWWVHWSLQWEDAYGIYGGPRGTATPAAP